MAVTREQQDADKVLQKAEEAWLRAYGWVEVDRGEWMHRKVDHQGRSYSLRDAVTTTRMDRTLGWPDRQYSIAQAAQPPAVLARVRRRG